MTKTRRRLLRSEKNQLQMKEATRDKDRCLEIIRTEIRFQLITYQFAMERYI